VVKTRIHKIPLTRKNQSQPFTLEFATPKLPPALKMERSVLASAVPLAFLMSGFARQKKAREEIQEEAGVQFKWARRKDTNEKNKASAKPEAK